MAIKVGEPAPDFTLPDQHGQPVTLSAVNGAALIVFFPAAFTPVCQSELDALRALALPDVTILAISCDSAYSLRAFSDAEGFDCALLSDFWPHGEVARAYGAFLPERGIAGRVSVLVDGAGVVRAHWESPTGQARDPQEYVAAATALRGQ